MIHNQRKILIIDDNVININILNEILEEYELRSATTGEEALQVARAYVPDLVLLDIMMPGIDGYEVCRRLRSDPNLRNAKIIMVSAKAMLSERMQGYDAGADDYITKPFEEDELLAKVNVYLQLRKEEEINQLKTDLLRLLSHDANTPLNGLLGPLELLMDNEGMEIKERQEWISIAYEGALAMQKLLNDTLALTGLRSGKWKFTMKACDFGTVLRSAVDSIHDQNNQCKISIEPAVSDKLFLEIDSEQITQVLVTVLSHAINGLSPSHTATVNVVNDPENIAVAIRIPDCVIDTTICQYYFNEFDKRACRYRSNSVGLSLAVARYIVCAHGGALAMECAPDTGTIFTIHLPNRLDDPPVFA